MSEPEARAQVARNLATAYPEIEAGGFTRVDGSVAFYSRIAALCDEKTVALDLGAGRGQQIEDTKSPFLRSLVHVQNRVGHLVGADVDEAVNANPYVDEAHVISPGAALPFEDSTFDLVYADWVLEHVATPETFASEVARIVKPGGWFCARTPNRWGMTGIATNLVPSRYHAGIVSRLQPGRKEIDVFPTVYKLNTRRRLRRHFTDEDWLDRSFFHNSEPPYVQRSRMAIGAVRAYLALTPPTLATVFMVFLQRRQDEKRS